MPARIRAPRSRLGEGRAGRRRPDLSPSHGEPAAPAGTIPRARRASFALLALLLFLTFLDLLLGLGLRYRFLPADLRAFIHGMPRYTRVVGNTAFTREPGLDVSYPVDRETHGDLVTLGLVKPDEPSGDGRERVRLRTDRFGFRSLEEHGRCDVVILGDSMAEGASLGEEAPFPLRLDRDSPRAICNLGISAAGTLPEIDLLARYGLGRRPRLVVLAYFGGNDLEDNLEYARIRARKQGLGSLSLFLRERPLLRLAAHALRPDRGGRTGAGAGRVVPPLNPIRGRLGDREVLLAFHDGYIRRLGRSREEIEGSEAWRITAALLREMGELARRSGAGLLVAYLPSKPHVYLDFLLREADPVLLKAYAAPEAPGSPEEFATRLRRHAGVLRDLVGELAAREGIRFVDLSGPLQEEAGRGAKVFLSYDTHLSPAGHEVVASVLGALIETILAPPGGVPAGAE